MTLPSIPSGTTSREYLRIGGGYGVGAVGSSPAGGADIDRAGNVAADGDLTIDGMVSAGAGLTFAGAFSRGPGGVDKTWQVALSATDFWPDATLGPTGPVLTVFSDNRFEAQALTYADATANRAYAVLFLPPDFDGSPLRFSVYWTCTTGGASGSVVWTIGGVSAGDTEDITGAPSVTYYAVSDALTAVGRLQIADITYSAPAAKPTLWFQLLRDGPHASDTLNAAAKLIGVRVSYA